MWPQQWRKLVARIEGLVEASDFLLGTFRNNREDPDSVVRRSVLPQLQELKTLLGEFKSAYGEVLPAEASSYLAEFLSGWTLPQATAPGSELRILRAIVPLALFCGTFEFLADDVEAEARTLTELAFEHLKRRLAVDATEREKWKNAFKHEVKCEKLGAVHLLSHGIWAFKVSNSAAATDLVYAEPIDDFARTIRRTARALVLTEWKVVRNRSELKIKADEARRQAKLYSGGILADLELKTTRYVVLVSEPSMKAPLDEKDGLVRYRHINLPIEGLTPSEQARRATYDTRTEANA